MQAKYIHQEKVHNLRDPKQIVPIIMHLTSPKSVIDVGCGLGTFLHEFKEQGVEDIHGLDGYWANKDLIAKNISLDHFEETDLEQPYQTSKRYDLAISLEVAEHLKKESASTFVNTLTNLSDIIIFSAAIPHQGGENHINEQWPSFWEKLFEQKGFQMLDIIRPLLWNNPNIFYWYKQNIFMVVKKNITSQFELNSITCNSLQNIVHPELYEKKCLELNQYKTKASLAYEGKLKITDYLEMIKVHIWRKIFNK